MMVFECSRCMISRLQCVTDAAPLYETVCKDLGWEVDSGRLAAMKSANEAELVRLEASIKDAEENLGDIEVRDAYLAKADYLYKIGVSPLNSPCLPLICTYTSGASSVSWHGQVTGKLPRQPTSRRRARLPASAKKWIWPSACSGATPHTLYPPCTLFFLCCTTAKTGTGELEATGFNSTFTDR